jgi:hypothetical protein
MSGPLLSSDAFQEGDEYTDGICYCPPHAFERYGNETGKRDFHLAISDPPRAEHSKGKQLEVHEYIERLIFIYCYYRARVAPN